MEFGEVMVRDALDREESCGCHFREEYQTEDGECLRNDKDYSYVAAWEFTGPGKDPILHKEPLQFDFAEVKQRSYK
jgi:succinate dehydrogenase / fumarate reductase flavoprotein subunit